MPSFTFKGFASASAVALTVAQGAMSEEAAVPTWGASGGGDQLLDVIEMNDAQMTATLSFVAPTAIWLRAVPSGFSVEDAPLPSRVRAEVPLTSPTSIYQAAYHELFYVWTITRPAGAASTFQPPGAYGYNMPTAWNNRNVMYGPLITLCFDVPGEHTVTLWAVDPQGNTATWTRTYTVADPNVAYAGPLTVCVNPSGNDDYSWAPAGAQTVTLLGTDVQRVQNALSRVNAAPSVTSRRLLLGPPGATFDLRTNPSGFGTNPLFINTGNASKRHYVAGAGSGVTIRHGLSQGFTVNRDTTTPSVTLANIAFRGAWYPEALASDERTSRGTNPSVYLHADTHYTVHRVSITNTGECINMGPDHNLGDASTPRFYRRLVLSECNLADWWFYASFLNPIDFNTIPENRGPFSWSYLGTKAVMNPLALMGPDKWGPDGHHNGYAVLRSIYVEWFHMACTDFFYPGYNQPLIRGPSTVHHLDTDTRPLRKPYSFANYDRTVWEGGANAFGNGINGPQSEGPTPVNAVVDKMLVLGTAETFQPVVALAPAITFRNAVIVMPGVARPAQNPGNRDAALSVTSYDSSGAAATFARANPVRIHNTSVIWLPTQAQNRQAVTLINPNTLPTATIENNVAHGPNIGQSAGTFATSTLAGVTPRYRGVNHAFINIQFNLTNLAPGQTWDVFYTNAARGAAGQPAAPFITAVTFDNRGPTAPPSQSYWTSNPTHNYHYIWRNTVANDPLPVPPTGNRGYTGTDEPTEWFFDAGQTTGNRITAQYLADRIRFTNNTTTTLNGTYRMHIDIRGLHPGPDPAFATPADLALVWRPSGGAAISPDRTGLWAVDDALGTARSAPWARGAFAAAG